MSFVDVREPHTNKLLFRYDPGRELVEIQRRGEKTVVDLTQYKVKHETVKHLWQGLAEYEQDASGSYVKRQQSAKESDGERQGYNGASQNTSAVL